jgi:hypothetical protein
MGRVHRGRIGELRVACQRRNETIPESQKQVGDAIEGPAFGLLTAREFTTNPTQLQQRSQREGERGALGTNQLLNAIEFCFAAGNRRQDCVLESRVADLFAAREESYFVFEDRAAKSEG